MKEMKVGDITIVDSVVFCIIGIYLAPPGSQSLIGVERVGNSKSTEFKIPIEFINKCVIFRSI